LRLAAIDLDGTLLRTDGTISERSRAAIRAVRSAGVVVVIVTARGPASVVDLARDAGIAGSAICSNGGLIVDLATGAIVRERLLETEIAVELVHALRERLPGIVFAVEHEAFAHEDGFSAWGWEPPAGTRVADALELLEDPATKIILRHTGYEVAAVAAVARELAGDRATVVQSGGEAVEVTAIGVNKAAGLAEVAAEHGIDAAHVIAFGDFLNDVPMLAWAGRGVAVANAHAEVLAIADEVTASNDDDGVAIVLEQLAG
jgi:Cof subfamily protein (haloacid dehalogenase superfamily)